MLWEKDCFSHFIDFLVQMECLLPSFMESKDLFLFFSPSFYFIYFSTETHLQEVDLAYSSLNYPLVKPKDK